MWITCRAGWAALRLRFGISPPTHFRKVCVAATAAVPMCSSSCRDPTKFIVRSKLSGNGRSRGVTFCFRCMVNCRRGIRIKPLRNTTTRKWSLPRMWPRPPLRSRASGWLSTAVWRVFRATTRTAASTRCSSSESASRAPNNAPGAQDVPRRDGVCGCGRSRNIRSGHCRKCPRSSAWTFPKSY